ncbi:hypothetical protein Godav_018278, partial [Gossypium davidsonii]|nr:hypothetical protein [Gossypium davidsonii]MBA0640678.1 hypothetical protein [Gossypium klotzschianum]
MENGIAGLRIDVEEEEAWLINGGAKTQKLMHEYFLVGCFLTANLGEKRFLFKFYHELDISRGHKWASWTFNNHLLVFHWLKDSEDPMEFGAFFGFFVEYDAKQISRGFKDFMRVQRNIKLGWNLFMRAPGRRVITTPSIWLREDDGSELYGKKLGRKIGGGTLGGSKGLQWTQDVEDTSIEELDRKKRLR